MTLFKKVPAHPNLHNCIESQDKFWYEDYDPPCCAATRILQDFLSCLTAHEKADEVSEILIITDQYILPNSHGVGTKRCLVKCGPVKCGSKMKSPGIRRFLA